MNNHKSIDFVFAIHSSNGQSICMPKDLEYNCSVSKPNPYRYTIEPKNFICITLNESNSYSRELCLSLIVQIMFFGFFSIKIYFIKTWVSSQVLYQDFPFYKLFTISDLPLNPGRGMTSPDPSFFYLCNQTCKRINIIGCKKSCSCFPSLFYTNSIRYRQGIQVFISPLPPNIFVCIIFPPK